jgi:Asp-tRNA(Asn)/Glu-tRNA(Gln) amidotransferase C subunit
MFDENEIPWIVKLNSMLRLYFSSEQKDEMTKTFLTIINLFKK